MRNRARLFLEFYKSFNRIAASFLVCSGQIGKSEVELVPKPYCGELSSKTTLLSQSPIATPHAPQFTPHTIFAGRCIEATIDDEDSRIEVVLLSTCFLQGQTKVVMVRRE